MKQKEYQNVIDWIWLTAVAFLIIGILIGLIVKRCDAGEIDLTKAVIHHTASHDVSAATIDRWHKERTYIDKNGKRRNWDGIGYHFVIRENGTIERGRSLNKRGAHAKGRNDRIGIVLTGYDKFSSLQKNALKRLLADLGIQNIEPHHERCPGEGLKLKEINHADHY